MSTPWVTRLNFFSKFDFFNPRATQLQLVHYIRVTIQNRNKKTKNQDIFRNRRKTPDNTHKNRKVAKRNFTNARRGRHDTQKMNLKLI